MLLAKNCTSYAVPPQLHSRVFGWLLCPFVLWQPTKATMYLISFIYCCSVWWLKQQANIAPHKSCLGCVFSQIPSPPPTPSFGCLLCQMLNGGHLRTGLRPDLFFSMGRVLAPQAKEPAAAIANPPPGACYGLMGSCGAKIWWHCCPAHGERQWSRWRIGWQWLMLVVVCCVVLCVVVQSSLATILAVT